jgi:hypothetical protein
MNTKIIQKCIEELKKETFSKEYVLGMLETYVEMSGDNSPKVMPFNYGSTGTVGTPNMVYSSATSMSDEEIIPDAVKVGPVATLNFNG